MRHIRNFSEGFRDLFKSKDQKNREDLSGQEEARAFGLGEFIDEFIKGIDNPIIMSMYRRMLDSNSFVKFGREIYSFTDEEKEKLEKIKPLLDNLTDTIAKIRDIQKGS